MQGPRRDCDEGGHMEEFGMTISDGSVNAIKNQQKAYGGMQMATTSLPTVWANKLLETEKVCRIR